MITLQQIDLEEKIERDPLYYVHNSIGVTRGTNTRIVTLTMRVDDEADLARIQCAVESLTRHEGPAAASERVALPAAASERVALPA